VLSAEINRFWIVSKRYVLSAEIKLIGNLSEVNQKLFHFQIGMALAMGRSTSRLPTMQTGMGEEVDEFVDGGEVDNGNQVEETMMWDVPVTEEMEQNNETGVVGGRQPVVIDQGHAVNRNNRQPPAATNIQYTASGSMGTSGYSLPATVRYR